MDVIRQEIQVAFSYPVHFTTGVFAASNRLLRDLSTASRATARAPGRSWSSSIAASSAAHPDLIAGDRALLPRARDALRLAAPVLVMPGGEQVKNDPRHTRAGARGDPRRRAVPPLVRGRGRRRRGARRRRLRGGDRAPRRPADPRPDHRAGAGRLGGRREERRQRLRQEELPRDLRAAVRGDQRLRVPGDALRPRLAVRDCRGGQGGADQGRRASSSCSKQDAPRAGRARRGRDGAAGPAVGGAPPARTSPAAAIRSSSVRRARSTSGTGRRTSSSS